MRNFIKIGLLSVLLLGTGLFFWPRNSPRAILDRAIAAHGGVANVGRCNVGRIQAKGTERMTHVGEVSLVLEEIFHLPGRYKRIESKLVYDRKLSQVTVVKDGVRRIRQNQGEIQQVPAEEEQEHMLMILRMLLQLRQEAFTLSSLPDSEVEGNPAYGIKVTVLGEWHGDLYFDQGSGLLVQARTKSTDPLGTEVKEERVFRHYQNFDGIQLPMRVITYRDGRKHLDMEIIDVEFLEQLDESVFDNLD